MFNFLNLSSDFILKLLLAIGLGALIGVEREFGREVEKRIISVGVRTSILISLLGFVFGFVSILIKNYIFLLVGLAIVLTIATAGYLGRLRMYGLIGCTTYTAIIITFILGVFVAMNLMTHAVALGILTTAVLAYRREFHTAIKYLKREEIESAIKFGILALVILPILPNRAIDPWGFFNPFKFWLVVIVLSILFFITYILQRILKEKGIITSAFLLGFVSSEPACYLFAQKARKQEIAKLISLVIAGGMLSYLLVFYITAYNKPIAKILILPVLFVIATALVLGYVKKRSIELEFNSNSILRFLT